MGVSELRGKGVGLDSGSLILVTPHMKLCKEFLGVCIPGQVHRFRTGGAGILGAKLT